MYTRVGQSFFGYIGERERVGVYIVRQEQDQTSWGSVSVYISRIELFIRRRFLGRDKGDGRRVLFFRFSDKSSEGVIVSLIWQESYFCDIFWGLCGGVSQLIFDFFGFVRVFIMCLLYVWYCINRQMILDVYCRKEGVDSIKQIRILVFDYRYGGGDRGEDGGMGIGR